MSKHNHKCNCEHTEVKFCKCCSVVYCKDCNQEWTTRSTYSWSTPYITYTSGGTGYSNQQFQNYIQSSGTTALDNHSDGFIKSACDHSDGGTK